LQHTRTHPAWLGAAGSSLCRCRHQACTAAERLLAMVLLLWAAEGAQGCGQNILFVQPEHFIT
jgi:hypothetical protein